MWVVAFGSNLSALWILVANSFMQQPVGYVLNNGRAEMADFFALLTNGHLWVQFPHVFFAGVCTAAFFVLGISAYHLLKKSKDLEVFQKSFTLGTIYAIIGTAMVILVGHNQAQYMFKIQPMKMAAAEALWESEDPAALSLFTIGDEKNRKDVFAIRVPYLLSILSYNKFEGEVKGINNLQEEYEAKYGPADYVPPVAISYWSFRIMAGAGVVMLLIALFALYRVLTNNLEFRPLYLKLMMWGISLPYLANATGWIFTEVARQPWVVFGVMRTEDAVSPTVTAGEVLFSLVAFTLLYGALMGATIYLLKKFAIAGTGGADLLDVPGKTILSEA